MKELIPLLELLRIAVDSKPEGTSSINEWIPLLQSLLWPIVLAVIVFWFQSTFQRILVAIAKRIEQGDSFEAGSSGVKLGSGQQSKDKGVTANAVVPLNKLELPHPIYLVHSTRRDKKLDTDEHEFYRLRIWLDADDSETLTSVLSVTYHLHPTFKNPIRPIFNEGSRF